MRYVHHCAGFAEVSIVVYDDSENWGWFVEVGKEPTPRSELSDELREYVQDYMQTNFPKMIGGEE